MKNIHMILSIACGVIIIAYVFFLSTETFIYRDHQVSYLDEKELFLPLPRAISQMRVEEAILLRRSVRDYTDDPIKFEHLGLILWSAYGVTEPRYGFKAVPSAGGTYPLELYVVIGERGVAVTEHDYLKSGVYKYDPRRHSLILIKEGDYREELSEAALGQTWVKEAPVSLVVFAVFERTTRIYGERGFTRYVPMEVGHLGQNVYLTATALGYGTVVVGAFYDDNVRTVIGASSVEVPMYIIPLGVPWERYSTTFEEIWQYIESHR